MAATIANALAAALYVIAAVLTLRLYTPTLIDKGSRAWAIRIGFAAIAVHAIALQDGVLIADGLDVGFFRAFALVGWIGSLLVLVTALKHPIESVGLVLYPATAGAIIAEMILPGSKLISSNVPLPLALHVLTSMLAYSLFTLAALQAIVLAIQDARLRRKHPGGFSRRLPPIPVMETLLFQWMGMGFVLLTIGLAVGWSTVIDIHSQHLAHKTAFSVISWIIFAVLLWGRARHGWRGKTAIRGATLGFAFLMLAYFGSKFVLELILHRQ